MALGFSCFNYPECRNTFETEFSHPMEREAEAEAGKAGWVIGYLIGVVGAHIACPDCAPILYEKFRL